MSELEFRETYRAYRIQVRRGRRLEALITPPGWYRPMDEVLTATMQEDEAALVGRAKVAIDADLRGSRR